jgi:(E)-4-hydroxy-3-methylbut-2-enyl-diphosphate synthase
MIQRRQTKTVTAGPIKLGSGHPIRVQTMTKVFTTDVDACVQQIEALQQAGCDMVRIAVPTKADTEALADRKSVV